MPIQLSTIIAIFFLAACGGCSNKTEPSSQSTVIVVATAETPAIQQAIETGTESDVETGPEEPASDDPGTDKPTTEETEQPLVEPEGSNESFTEAEPIQVEELIGDTVVENFVTNQGVSVEVNRYSISSTGLPQIELKLNNNSAVPIFNSMCTVAALENNVVIDLVNILFAELYPIDPGESAINSGSAVELNDWFSSISKIRIECDWTNGDNDRKDIVNGATTVFFLDYSTNSTNPSVRLQLLNHASDFVAVPVPITDAVCGVEAKRGNVIIDVATVTFFELLEISPNQAVDATGTWLKLSSLDDFDSEPFDIANVNCFYRYK